MEALLSRYRNLTVLLLLLVAQLLLLAYQVKTKEEVRLIRIWAVTAVTPLARLTEWMRSTSAEAWNALAQQRRVRDENEQLKRQVADLKLENQFLKAELGTGDRALALQSFSKRIPSKTISARVIATATGSNARVVYIDRGSAEGIRKGMPVVTPEGIVGRVVSSYPTASLVSMITAQGFAAGVISQKTKFRGTLRGRGTDNCVVEFLQGNEQSIEDGEMFFTSGDDRSFPRGLPVGPAKLIRSEDKRVAEVRIKPVGLSQGPEVVLVVVQGLHGEIPAPETASPGSVQVLPPPPPSSSTSPTADPIDPGQGSPIIPSNPASGTEADRLLDRYRKIGESQGLTYGNSSSKIPEFNKPINPPAAVPQGGAPANSSPPTDQPQTRPNTSSPAPAGAKPGSSSGAAPIVPNPSSAPAKPPASAPVKPLSQQPQVKQPAAPQPGQQ